MIQIDYFIIESQGDTSVGIFPSQWEITNTMYFEDEDEVTMFKGHISRAFEYVCDTNVRILDSRDFGKMNKISNNT